MPQCSCFQIPKRLLENSGQLMVSSIGSKKHFFLSKTTPKDFLVEKTYNLAPYMCIFIDSVTHIGFKKCSHILDIYLWSNKSILSRINSSPIKFIPEIQEQLFCKLQSRNKNTLV